jgi:hypothetical protein
VCVEWRGADGKLKREVRHYDAKRQSVRATGIWFKELGVAQAALESAANCWRPAFDQLETVCVVVLVNPYFVKRMPGRKTGAADCIWIATLPRKGLLRASFIPPRGIPGFAGPDAVADGTDRACGEGRRRVAAVFGEGAPQAG